MEIRILIRTTEPLTGTATSGGEEPVQFAGWLELLDAISRLTGAREAPGDQEPCNPTRVEAVEEVEGEATPPLGR